MDEKGLEKAREIQEEMKKARYSHDDENSESPTAEDVSEQQKAEKALEASAALRQTMSSFSDDSGNPLVSLLRSMEDSGKMSSADDSKEDLATKLEMIEILSQNHEKAKQLSETKVGGERTIPMIREFLKLAGNKEFPSKEIEEQIRKKEFIAMRAPQIISTILCVSLTRLLAFRTNMVGNADDMRASLRAEERRTLLDVSLMVLPLNAFSSNSVDMFVDISMPYFSNFFQLDGKIPTPEKRKEIEKSYALALAFIIGELSKATRA